MPARRGFALVAVMAAIVIMAMVVAVGTQRAVVAIRQGAVDLAAAEMTMAAADAQSAALEESADSAHRVFIAPGAPLASGVNDVGSARVRWTLLGSVSPYATIEIEAWAPVFAGTARQLHHALVVPRTDSSGLARWAPAGAGGWTRSPAP